MELALEYDRPLGRGLRWHVYGGPAGEPALGPVAFPHRVSAMPNPHRADRASLARRHAHHLRRRHGRRVAAVAAGMPKHRRSTAASPTRIARTSISAALDSYSARFSVAPTAATVLQVSAGHLNEAERHAGLPRDRRHARHRVSDLSPRAESIDAVGNDGRLGHE